MEDVIGTGGGIIALIGLLFALLLATLWIALPFAVFGIKGKLDTVITHMRKANGYLETIAESSKVSQTKGD